MTTDFRALCAELHQCIEYIDRTCDVPIPGPLLTRARAALAQSVGEGPTDEELLGCMLEAAASVPGGQCTGILDWDQEAVAAARAVLARWGHPAAPPAPEPGEVAAWLDQQGQHGCSLLLRNEADND